MVVESSEYFKEPAVTTQSVVQFLLGGASDLPPTRPAMAMGGGERNSRVPKGTTMRTETKRRSATLPCECAALRSVARARPLSQLHAAP